MSEHHALSSEVQSSRATGARGCARPRRRPRRRRDRTTLPAAQGTQPRGAGAESPPSLCPSDAAQGVSRLECGGGAPAVSGRPIVSHRGPASRATQGHPYGSRGVEERTRWCRRPRRVLTPRSSKPSPAPGTSAATHPLLPSTEATSASERRRASETRSYYFRIRNALRQF